MASSAKASAWTDRVIMGSRVGAQTVPTWLQREYELFSGTVQRKDYPCHFGTAALRSGDIYVAYVEGKDWSELPATLLKFIEIAGQDPFRRRNLALFLQPGETPPSEAEFHRVSWEVLQYLHDNDEHDPSDYEHSDPDSALWEFPFGGTQFFVVGTSPTYVKRRSRRVCETIVLLFQPRSVFDGAFGHAVGDSARGEVRARLLQWDAVPVHPELRIYGEEGSREWKQYVLPDDDLPVTTRCPLRVRNTRNEQTNEAANERILQMNRETKAGQLAPARQIIEQLSSRIDEFIAGSQFFADWVPGQVSQKTASRFLLAFDQLVASFPPLIALATSRLGEGGRVLLAKNLFEECGEGDSSRTHHAVYRRYMETVGLDWRDARPHSPTVNWRRQLREMTLEGEPAEAVGAIAAGEFLAQPALSRIFEALKPLSEGADIEYFTTHLQLETEHVEEVTELITIECPEDGAYAKVLRGFEAGLACWGTWFDAIAAEVFSAAAPNVEPEWVGALS